MKLNKVKEIYHSDSLICLEYNNNLIDMLNR